MFPIKDNIPNVRFPIVTVALIVLNLAVFVWQLSLSEDPGSSDGDLAGIASVSERDAAAIQLGAIPYRITHPSRECDLVADPESGASGIFCEDTPEAELVADDSGIVAATLDAIPWWLTVITSMFLHAGIFHLAGNMLFLWVFGNSVENSMGPGRFVAFYLLSGAVAVYAQAAFNVDATGPTIGASGAVLCACHLLLHLHRATGHAAARGLVSVAIPARGGSARDARRGRPGRHRVSGSRRRVRIRAARDQVIRQPAL